MAKTKLTLTIDKEIIRQAKSRFALNDKSISNAVEELLKSYTNLWLNKLMKDLDVKEKYVSYDDVIRTRKPGFDAGKIVRSMRNARSKNISRF